MNRGGNVNFGTDEQEKEKIKLVQNLYFDYRGYKDINPERTQDTCHWFLESDRFLRWRDRTDSALLWITAYPGCGKSVLARALVDEGKACTTTDVKPYYYFFNDQGNVTEASALRALLHQYFIAHPDAVSFALQTYRNLGDQLKDNASQLWELLIDILRRSDGNEMVIIIDALDECAYAERKTFISRIGKLYHNAGLIRTLRLKILITSRPYPDIEDSFEFDFPPEAATFLHFEGESETEAIAKDVNAVLESRLPRMTKGLSTSQRQRLLEALKATPNRKYLWVHLILDRLQDQLRNCFVAADRPLKVQELLGACTIYWDTSSRSWPVLDAADVREFGKTLRSILNLMVIVHEDKVYFIHATAREFVLKSQDHIKSADWHGWQHFDISEAHSFMTALCMKTICTLQEEDCLPEPAPNNYCVCHRCRCTSLERSFYNYSAERWYCHFHQATNIAQNDAMASVLQLCDPEDKLFHLWSCEDRGFCPHIRNVRYMKLNPTQLSVSIRHNLVAVAGYILNGINEVGIRQIGRLDMFFTRGVVIVELGTIKTLDETRLTALEYAYDQDHRSMIRMLLSKGVARYQ